ncbi:MAG TPA: hypothetical protein VF385_01680 [Patescibacteria group bacterium]
MLESRKVDYTKPSTWSEDNLPEIAKDLGYVPDQRFRDTFRQFVIETVANARVTDFLLVVARNAFNRVKPPLQRSTGTR